jgi:hypothetical protein
MEVLLQMHGQKFRKARSHFDVDHKNGFRSPTPAVNLTMIGDPLDKLPVGPPFVTTVEPNEELDLNELTFTGAWCCPSDNAPRGNTTVTRIPKLNDSRDIRDIGPPMPALSQRHCDDTSSDKDSSTDESKCGQYYEWEQDLDKNEDKMDETHNDNVKSTVIAPLIQLIQMLIVTAQIVLLTCLTFGSLGAQWGVHTERSTPSTYVIEPLWSTIVLPLFWVNTLFWDGARWLTTPDNDGHKKGSSSVSRRFTRMSHKRERKRATHLPSLYFFAETWLIFKGTVHLLPTAYHGYQPTHPFSEVKNRMLDTYQRVESLDAMVVLSPGVFMQYQKIQVR